MTEVAVLGGGCFWCTEAVFRRLKGVATVTPGYAGGQMPNPDYEAVSSGQTGHAEVIKLEFDPAVIPYDHLLDVFFAVHDATQVNRQGADVGTQYRSIILTTSPQQSATAKAKISEQKTDQPIVTQVDELKDFYTAEEYHIKYYDRNPTAPYCTLVIVPKLDTLREKFPDLIKENASQ